MKLHSLLTLALFSTLLAGCVGGAKSTSAFRLPDGDADRGKTAFIELKCYTCHTVSGVELPSPCAGVAAPIVLGGEVAQVKTCGQLLTAIVHPSFDLSPQLKKERMEGAKLSPMGSFNHIMTVQQMVDLVAFLQPQYKLQAIETYSYVH